MIKGWSENKDGTVNVVFADDTGVVISKTDMDRAFGTILNATKESIIKDYGIRELKFPETVGL